MNENRFVIIVTMKHVGLIICLFFAANTLIAEASDKPLECYLAEAKSKELVDLTTYVTVLYVVAYRTIPPLLSAFRYMLNTDKPSGFRAGIIAALQAACTPSVGLISAVQVLSIVSFLVPPYFISEHEHADADCQTAIDLQNNANHTSAYDCHRAEADESIFKKVLAYNIGLYAGIYVAMPILTAAIVGWKKGCAMSPHQEPNSPSFETVVPIQENTHLGFGDAMAKGLKEGMIAASPYSLIDAAVWTAIINFVTPLYTYTKKLESRQKCAYEQAKEKARSDT